MNPDPWGDLTEAEQAVIEAAEKGDLCELGEGDPAAGETWGEDRNVRAKVVYALCCETGPEWPVHAKGVRIKGARIKDSLDFEDATLRAPLHLIACYFERPVGLLRARARAIVLSGSHVPGISGNELRTNSSFRLDNGFSAKGKVSLLSATIGRNLDCDGGSFENPQGTALELKGASASRVDLRRLAAPPVGIVDLTDATVGSYMDDREGWPQPAQLRLEGFRYSSIDPLEVDLRREWLQLAPFSSQPYAHLAGVLKTGGSSEAAQRIFIEHQRERLRRGQDSMRTRLGLRFLGLTVGFGYKPGRAVWALLGFFLCARHGA